MIRIRLWMMGTDREAQNSKKNNTGNTIADKGAWLDKAAVILSAVLLIAGAILLFVANGRTPFMMDDEWYSTNLVTGESLKGPGDIIASQIWHYRNWGGRSITHGLLQLSLMSGEMCADIINVIATLLLVFEMYILTGIVAGKDKSPDRISLYGLLFGTLILCCPNFRMSMLWQAGCANYVYSSVWILLFYICYLRALDEDRKDLPFTWLFIIPLGLITGWSTENMGPAACAIAFFITVICIREKKAIGRKRFWMTAGCIASFAGSVICIIAPGNFIRKDDSAGDLSLTFTARMLQMLKGAGSYLFPALLVFAVSYILYRAYFKEKLGREMIVTLMGALLSYGAMVLSPHYPDRAAFGTCILIEVCAGALISRLSAKRVLPGSAPLSCMLLISSILVMYTVIAL